MSLPFKSTRHRSTSAERPRDDLDASASKTISRHLRYPADHPAVRKHAPSDSAERDNSLNSTSPDSCGDLPLSDIEKAYRIQRPMIISSLIKRGVDAAEAEDVAQEVFVRALQCPARLCSVADAATWLVTCARNLAIDRYRHRSKEVLVPLRTWNKWEAERGAVPTCAEVPTSEVNCCEQLRDAISHLPLPQRECLTLRCQGLTFREIAIRLQTSLRTAAYLAESAIEVLRQTLGREVDGNHADR